MTEEDDETTGQISFSLEFAANECPSCGQVAEPGPCPSCGTTVDATTEKSPTTRARISALEPLAARIEELSLGFAEIEPGTIPLTAEQMVTAINDAELFDQVAAMVYLGHQLGQIDLNDPDVIGRELRRSVRGEIAKVERLLDTCRLLGRFDPPGPAADLPIVSIEAGAYGVSILEATVATLVAPDIGSARRAQARLQTLLDNVPFEDSFGELVAEVEASIDDASTDARITRALGRPGDYADDLDQIDLGRVFAAFANEEQPFVAVGSRARNYFSHLLEAGVGPDPGLDAMLILPAVGLASLDRPLLGHRLAELVAHLSAEAWEQDPAAVQAVIDRTGNQGELVFAAAGRIARCFRLLELAALSGQIDDQTVLQTVMDTYLELAEGAYRTCGWMVRDLAVIAGGGTVDEAHQPPMLSDLANQLEAVGGPAATLAAAGTDPRLRNARGHAQYRWAADEEEVEDLRTGDRWSVHELERAAMALVGTVLGADAGYVAFLASGRPDLVLPAWLSSGRSLEANTLMAQMSFGGFGFEVIEVRDGGRTIVIERPEPLDKTRLISPAGGLAGVVRGLGRITVLDQDSETLLTVDPEIVVQALAEPEEVRELACLAPLMDDAERSGVDPAEALNRVVSLQAVLVAVTGMQAVVDAGHPDPSELRLIERRLSFVLDFARRYPVASAKENKRLLERISRARNAAFVASRGLPGGFDRLATELPRLVESAHDRGVEWPPF